MTMGESSKQELVQAWKAEEKQPFAGWDFSYLDGRMIEDEPPWSYMSRAATLMAHSASVLDMGTGGGERLLQLEPDWPEKVVVTEDYAPNIELASQRLRPLGVRAKVVELTSEGTLPFENGEFDLILNRHSGLNPVEVARVLAPGGTFLTQQIHGLWAWDLAAVFGAEPLWPECTLETYRKQFEAAHLTIVSAEDWSGKLSFTDVGAIVYYLTVIPWTVPGFSVETHLDALWELQRRSDVGAGLCFIARKFLLEARKSGES